MSQLFSTRWLAVRKHPHHQSLVLFESNLAVRTYILNRPLKLNALNEPMLSLLRPKIEVRLPVVMS